MRYCLKNEKYAGDLLLQKFYTNNHVEKKRFHNRGELPQYFVGEDHEPIIDREIFEAVQREIADGHGVVRAACGYLKRMLAAPKKGMVPIARTTAAGTVRPGSRIEQMSDREFAAFSKRAQEAMMAGRKVRVE